MAGLEEEAVEPNEAAVAAADLQQMPQHHGAAQVPRRGVYGCASELEGEANGKIGHPGDDKSGEVQHHHVAGVLRPRQARRQEREAGLHEEHEGARDQQPCEVYCDLLMTDECGQTARLAGRALRRVLLAGRRLAGVREPAAAVP